MNNQCLEPEQLYKNKINYSVEYEKSLVDTNTNSDQSEFENEISMLTQS